MKTLCFGFLVMVCQPIGDGGTTTIARCAEKAAWSAQYQRELAAERRRVNSPVITEAIREAIRLRAQADACRGSKTP